MSVSRPFLWVAVAAPLAAGVDLGRRVLATNDEARFAVLAQDVLGRGDWLFPQLNGAVYYNKPVLLAWLIALGSWPAGRVTQLTAVLPSALAAVGTALVLYALGRDLFGADAGKFAALVALTTQGLFLHARLPIPDMLMTFCFTASLWMLWRTLRGRRGPYWLGFYGLVGVAFWTKGLAGLFPLAVALAWALASGRAGFSLLRLPLGLPVLAILMAPWWFLSLATDRAAVQHVVVADQFWWYLPGRPTFEALMAPLQHLFGILFPWVLVVPIALLPAVRFLRGRGAERDGVLFVLVWAAVTVGLAALSHQQRVRYYLPAMSPSALLIGWWLAGAVVRYRPAGAIPWRAYGIVAAVLAGGTLALIGLLGRWPKELAISLPASILETSVLTGAGLVMVAALVHGVRHNRLGRAFGVAWLASAVLVAGTYHWELERRNAAYDYPRISRTMRPFLPEAGTVAVWGLPELPLSFYLGRPVAVVETDQDLRRTVAGRPPGIAIVTEAALARVDGAAPLAVLAREPFALRQIAVVTIKNL